ncbi:MAG: helix-turn-helix domain-containing protein [Candidatus Enterenecus sp.]
MEIGTQIRALRSQRGITQEAMAQHFGITPQAVSKWERGAASPDIGMLPAISAYFGVTTDDLFALSDETRMERIQNMLWDVRFISPEDAERERRFLLEKARREPDSSEPYEMLAELELHLAQQHNTRAEEYALEAMDRDPRSGRAPCALAHAMGGKHVDPRNNTHNALISYYKECIEQHPEALNVYAWLIAQLIDDRRLDEARHYCDLMAQNDDGYFVTVHRIKLALARNEVGQARAMWEQMGREYPENWSVHHWIGDFQTQAGEYAAARESYRRAISLMSVPRYTDPIDSLAQVCEMDGDIPGAVAAKKLELEVTETEWGDVSGESVDCIRREIARLEGLL